MLKYGVIRARSSGVEQSRLSREWSKKMYLYIIVNSSNNIFYIGTTQNIERRLKEHNGENSHFTGKVDGTWELVFRKYYPDNTEARKEEIRLKRSKNKKYILWYIENNKSS